MLNKLEFINSPHNGYSFWNKYEVIYKTVYDWHQHYVKTSYLYHWNKYDIATSYKWSKSSAQTTIYNYKWNYYEGATTYNWDKIEVVPSKNIYIHQTPNRPNSNTFLHTQAWLGYFTTEDLSFNNASSKTITVNMDFLLQHYDGSVLKITYPMPVKIYSDKTCQALENIDFTQYVNQGYIFTLHEDTMEPDLVLRPKRDGSTIFYHDTYTDSGGATLGYWYGNGEQSYFRMRAKENVLIYDNYNNAQEYQAYDGWSGSKRDSNDLLAVELLETVNTKGNVVDTITSQNKNAYPNNGVQDGYYYTATGSSTIKASDTVIGSLYGTTPIDYPTDCGYEINGITYYLEYEGAIEDYEVVGEGDFIEYVFANLSSAYPQNGVQGEYWYRYIDYTQSPNNLIEEITNEEIIYPTDGVEGNYYYKLYQTDTIYSKDNYYQTVSSENINEYPEDGKMYDWWYVYAGSRQVPNSGIFIEEVYDINKDAYPADGIQDNFYYTYQYDDYIYEKTFTNANLMGGVNYTFDLSANTDFTIGMVSSAEIKYVVNLPYSEAEWYINQPCIYSVKYAGSDEWKEIGIFNITDITKKDKLTCEMVGYDNIIKLDKVVDTYLKALTFPNTLGNVYTGLMNYLGLDYTTQNILNSGYSIDSGFEIEGITGRQVLEWIAECAGGYGYANTEGEIDIKEFGTNTIGLDNSKYAKYSNGCFNTNKIDKLTIQQDEEDLGISVGSGENVYKIIGNPFLVATDSNTAYLTQAANNIFNNIKDISYSTADISLYQDFNVDVGEYVNVSGNKHLILNKQITNSGVSLSSTGNQSRPVSQGLNSELLMLKGKSNKFIRDLDKTQSTITDLEKGLQSQITQTADSINTRITNEVEGLESTIQQTADSLELKIESATGSSSSLQVQLDQINTRITNEVDGLESTITQTANSINSTITSQDGRINSIEQTLDGVVYDNGSGTTIINGDNITTGTISADRINMTGSISWGDLDSSCQSTIIGLGGGSDVSLPSYIKSTYIDSTQILSPTISGGTLNGTVLNLEKEGWIYDADSNRKSRFIYNRLDQTSDTCLRIGRCNTTSYTNKYNSIDFVDNSGDRIINLRADEVNILSSGTAQNDTFGCLTLQQIYPAYNSAGTVASYIGDKQNLFQLIYANNFYVGTTTTTSNAYCGFSASNYLQKYSGSSQRHKHNIHSLNDDLKKRFEKLYDLEVKNWTYNDDYIDPEDQLYQTETFGLIAEDIASILPEMVVYDNGEIDNYRDRHLINAMLYLIQEQKKMIDRLEERIGDLENGVN